MKSSAFAFSFLSWASECKIARATKRSFLRGRKKGKKTMESPRSVISDSYIKAKNFLLLERSKDDLPAKTFHISQKFTRHWRWKSDEMPSIIAPMLVNYQKSFQCSWLSLKRDFPCARCTRRHSHSFNVNIYKSVEYVGGEENRCWLEMIKYFAYRWKIACSISHPAWTHSNFTCDIRKSQGVVSLFELNRILNV